MINSRISNLPAGIEIRKDQGPMCLDEPDFRRLLSVGDASVRSRGFDYLHWLKETVAGACVVEGDATWAAIDVRLGKETLARIFPKKAGLLKIANRAGLPAGQYGPTVDLAKGEWVFDLRASTFDSELVRRCTLENATERSS